MNANALSAERDLGKLGERSGFSAPLAVMLGGLAVGIADGLDAVVFFGMRGVEPMRIFQAIASGVLGRAAFSGGTRTALLGVALHFGIALTIVTVYYLASRALPSLARRPFVWGPLYGIAVWLVMNFVVLPLSAAGTGAMTTPVIVNGLLIHIFGVGLLAALAARMARRANE